MDKKDFSKEREAQIPDKKERDSFRDLEIEILEQITKSLKGHRKMEAYFLAWTVIEQFMLPRLIRFVVKGLKIATPKDFFSLPINHLIKNYYLLSQDYELYMALEKARKNRNRLVHETYERNDWKTIKGEYVKSLKKDIGPAFSLFQDRFNGKTKIPVLTLYTNGWNDGLEKVKNEILSKI